MNKNRKGLMALEGLDAALDEPTQTPEAEAAAPAAENPVAEVVDPAAPGAATPADVAVPGGPADVTSADLDPAAVEAAVDPAATEVPAADPSAAPVTDPAADPAVDLGAVEAPVDPVAEGTAGAATTEAADAAATVAQPTLDAPPDTQIEGVDSSTPPAADPAPIQSAIDETLGAIDPATGPGDATVPPADLTDPVTDAAAPAADPVLEPAATEPAADPLADPAAAPAAEPAADPTAPPADPAAEPAAEPATDPVTAPVADPATEPALDVEPELDAPDDEAVPADVVDADEEVLDIDQQLDNLTEGEVISDGVDAIGEKMEASVERGEGLSDEDTSVINAVMEGYYERLSYARPKGKKTLSLEGANDPSVRLANTKQALEELKVFRKKLDVSLNYAHEGLLDTISAHLGNASAKIRVAGEQLQAWSKKYDQAGPVTGPIKGGRWANSLGGFRTELVKPGEVAARVKEIERALIQGQPTKVVRDLTVIAKSVAAELGKGKSQVAGQEGIERKIDNFREAAHNVREALSAQSGKAVVASSFEPLDKASKSQLVHSAQNIAHELLALSEAWEGFRGAIGEIRRAADKAEKSQTTSTSSGGRTVSGRTAGFIIGGILAGLSGGVPVAGAVLGFAVGVAIDHVRSGPVKWTKTEQSAYKNQAGDVKAEANDTLRSLVELDANTLRVIHGVIGYLAKSTA